MVWVLEGGKISFKFSRSLGILNSTENGFMEPQDYAEVIEHPNHYLRMLDGKGIHQIGDDWENSPSAGRPRSTA